MRKQHNMNTYIAIYKGQQKEIKSVTMFDAMNQARAFFKPPRKDKYLVSCTLVAVGEREIIHTAVN